MRILYCHCAYARVVPPDVKQEVLRSLSEGDADFDAVPDLCEMSARRDPALKEIAEGGDTVIVACYPRAVKWLFHAAGTPLPDTVRVFNMRVAPAADIVRDIESACGHASPRLPVAEGEHQRKNALGVPAFAEASARSPKLAEAKASGGGGPQRQWKEVDPT